MNAAFLLACVLMSDAPRELVTHWNLPQSIFLQRKAAPYGPTFYTNYEGAVRAGKSTPAARKLADYALEYPGINLAAARWTQDGLDAQVKPIWRDTARKLGLELDWHTDEEYDEIVCTRKNGERGTGSRVYLRALKASEETARYGKLAGLTLAVIWIDQPEEVPEDVYRAYVPTRLSQPGFPHEIILTPNPTGENHWIAEDFPEHNPYKDRFYLHTSIYDNRPVLGDQYIADMEAAYPPGHPLRRRFIDGKRGLSVVGKPVYGGYFIRSLHVRSLSAHPDLPIYEAWDYGHKHPAVSWHQFPPTTGGHHVLGGVMGESMFLKEFVPIALRHRDAWFPRALEFMSTGDPAGDSETSHGTEENAVRIMRGFKVHPLSLPGANHPDRRDSAIQAMAGIMRGIAPSGPLFGVDPDRCVLVSKHGSRPMPILSDAFESGYVWDERAVGSSASPNTRRPKKDGFYDHLMNTCEYAVLGFGPVQKTQKQLEQDARRAQRYAQRDEDDYDRRQRAASRASSGRGGY